MKVQQNKKTGQFFLNLPKQICLAMSIQKGQNIKISVNDRKTLIFKKE